MFISSYNTYLIVIDKDISHRFICEYYEDDAPPPATSEDLRGAGFEIENISVTRFALVKKDKGYLSACPDLSWGYVQGMERSATFRVIDPAILPPRVPEFTEQEHIAKNIHQVGIFHKEPGVYPQNFIENRNEIVFLNQNYVFYYWSEGGYYDIENFIREKYGDDILEYYRAINPEYPATRADLFRYLCLYAMGGVYLDLKSTISYPLDTIIKPQDRFLLSCWYHNAHVHTEIEHMPYGEYEQYYIMCAAGHPLMRRIIQQALCSIRLYKHSIHFSGHNGTLRVAGPLMYSMIVHEYREKYKDIVRQIHSLSNGIEYTIFTDNSTHRIYSEGGKHYSDKTDDIILLSHFEV